MTRPDDGLFSALLQRGVSRRTFLRFCVAMAGALALPTAYASRIAAAVEAAPRIPVLWLRGQACGADSEALFVGAHPTVAELLLDLVSVEYHEGLMAPSGVQASLSRTEIMEAYPDGYFAVVEGSIPTAGDGFFCASAGAPHVDVVRGVCDGALATIAVGSCAFDGGLAAAGGGATGAVGAGSIVGTDRLVNLPGCPANVENVTATIVHYLTFKELPARDGRGRPLFAYGNLVHNQCERRAHFEFGEFVSAWGDEAAQKDWCLSARDFGSQSLLDRLAARPPSRSDGPCGRLRRPARGSHRSECRPAPQRRARRRQASVEGPLATSASRVPPGARSGTIARARE